MKENIDRQASNRIDLFATAWARWVTHNRWKTIVASLLVAIGIAAGLMKLDVSNNYRVFFSNNNPDLISFETFEETYRKNDNFLFVFKPASTSISDPVFMSAIEDFTEKAWKIPFAIRVDSITNFQHTYAEEDDLIVVDLIENAVGKTPEYLDKRVDIALDEPLLSGRLVALDKGATGINVTLQYPGTALDEVPKAISFARDLVAEFERDYPDMEIAISGVSALNAAMAEATVNDAKTLFGPMFLVLVFVTWLIVRSIAGTLATVAVIILATLTAMGFSGWAGITMSPFSGSAPVVILTLAIADSVHILITLMQRLSAGDSKLEAIIESVRVNFLAVSITSLTTIVGFLALNFSDAPPFNALGNISAVGIASAWFFSLTFFPAFMTLMPVSAPAESAAKKSQMNRLIMGTADMVIRRPRTVLYSSLGALIILSSMIPKIDLNDQWIEYFDHRIEFRGDAEFAIEHLTGLYLLDYSVSAGEEQGSINNPEYLYKLEAFTEWLRGLAPVLHVYSYSDIIKRLNKNLNGDNPDYYRLPDDRDLAAQYLLLYEISLPYGLDLNDRIDVNKSSTRVTITLDDITTKETRALLEQIDSWWQSESPETSQYATGATYLFSFISERNIRDMVGGNLIAVLMIAAILMLALRSVGFGALSLVPNVAPLLMTFGVWAIFVGQVGMAAATVSATSLGIIVDNTVHFLTKYRRAKVEQGLSASSAVRYSFNTVGMAVAANALILALGFGVLSLSSFKITAEMGTLTAIAILIALVVDFLLLPSLLLQRKERLSKEFHYAK